MTVTIPMSNAAEITIPIMLIPIVKDSLKVGSSAGALARDLLKILSA